jgi:hypothetical protein
MMPRLATYCAVVNCFLLLRGWHRLSSPHNIARPCTLYCFRTSRISKSFGQSLPVTKSRFSFAS